MIRLCKVYRIIVTLIVCCVSLVHIGAQDITATNDEISSSLPTESYPSLEPTKVVVTQVSTEMPKSPTSTPLLIPTNTQPVATNTVTPLQLTPEPTIQVTQLATLSNDIENMTVSPTFEMTIPVIGEMSPIPDMTTESDGNITILSVENEITPVTITPVNVQISTPIADTDQLLVPSQLKLIIVADTVVDAKRFVTIQIHGKDLYNLYGMVVNCTADTTVYRGLQALPDNLFPPSSAIKFDQGFQADGRWEYGALLQNPALPITGSGALFMMNWEVLTLNPSQMRCHVVLSSRSGESLPVENPILVVDPNAGNTPELDQIRETTVSVIATATPILLPTLTLTSESIALASSTWIPEPTITLLPTLIPTIAPTLVEMPLVSHSNKVLVQGYIENTVGLNGVDIIIIGSETLGQLSLERSEQYQFSVELPRGNFTLRLLSTHHLPLQLEINVVTEPIMLPPLTLVNGDINEDGVIDLIDGTLLSASYGRTEYMPNADLNHDGSVDIFDMAIFSGNFGERARLLGN